MPITGGLIVTLSPDGASGPDGELVDGANGFLDAWEEAWVVYVVCQSGPSAGTRWAFYRADKGVPSDFTSHDFKNPTQSEGMAEGLAMLMLNCSLSPEQYLVFASDATLKHSVAFSSGVYSQLFSSSSSSE